MEIEKQLHFADLIFKQINEGLTAEEQQELTDWIEANPSNGMLIEEITKANAQDSAIDFMNSLSVNDAWNQVKMKLDETESTQTIKISTPQRKYFAWSAVAALLIIGFFIWKPNHIKPTTSVATTTEITPGSNKATLTLADGRIISLDDLANGGIDAEKNVQVIKMDGVVQYNTSDNNHEIAYNTIQTPKGGKYQLILADGTVVWLNAASSLRFPVAFVANERLVELKGEAYFEVKKDAKKPFRVTLENGSQIEVKGTSFNINAYQDEEFLRTTLVEGKINFLFNGRAKSLLPLQQIKFDKALNEMELLVDVDIYDEIAWKNDLFIFKSMDVKSIMRIISRWYDIDVVYQGKINPETFSGIVSSKSNLSQVLKIMEAGGIQFKIEGRKIVVF
jgi:ferric-dicitrate binding protein FerR (iron transport regulator)